MSLVASLAISLLSSDVMAQGRKPGSLLFYPVHRSGATYFTVVNVTNTNLTPKTLTSFGGSTNVHFNYVNVTRNPANAFRPLACTVFDRLEFLTPADTISVMTGCHNATTAGGQEGYLVVYAEDPSLFSTAWSHNDLIGSELVINASGAAYALNAVPFSSPVAFHKATDLNNNGHRDMNGTEYSEAPDVLYVDSFVALAGSQLCLTNLTGADSDINSVYFSVWNDNEYPLSATLDFNCWFDQPLTAVSPLFAEAFLKSLPNDPSELDINCDGRNDLEVGWAAIQSVGVRTVGGLRIASDGALLGSITAGPSTLLNGGHLLWESVRTQGNGGWGH